MRPRFDGLGGDPARLHLLRGSVIGDGETAEHDPVWLTDVSALRDALDQTMPGCEASIHTVVLGGGRRCPAELTKLVRYWTAWLALPKDRCCVLLLRHLSKARPGRAIHRGLGSINMTGAVRTEMLAGCSPDDPQQRALVQIKNNLGAYAATLGYVIDETGNFLWTGESLLTQSDILAPESTEQAGAKKEEAAGWLRTYLAGRSSHVRRSKAGSRRESDFPGAPCSVQKKRLVR